MTTFRFTTIRPFHIVFVLCTGIIVATIPFLIATLGLNSDFLAFFTVGHTVLRGQLAHLYDPELFRTWQQTWVSTISGRYRFIYLPMYAGVYLPFAGMPLLVSRLSMVLLSGIALAVSVRLSRMWQSEKLPIILLGLTGFPALYVPFLVGQNSFITLLLFTTITVFMKQHRRMGIAGVCAGLLLYKPQLVVALIMVWMVRREWRAVAAFGATAILSLIASWILAPAATLQFLGVGQGLLATTTTVGANVSFYATLAKLMPLPLAQGIALGIAGFVVAALIRAWWRIETPSPYHYAILWLAPLLITPYLAAYDLVLGLLPLALLLPELRSNRTLQWLVILWWYSPVINLVAGEVVVLSAWTTLALFLFCLRQCSSRPVPSSPLPSLAHSRGNDW